MELFFPVESYCCGSTSNRQSSSGHSSTVVVGVRVKALVSSRTGPLVSPIWWKTNSGARARASSSTGSKNFKALIRRLLEELSKSHGPITSIAW